MYHCYVIAIEVWYIDEVIGDDMFQSALMTFYWMYKPGQTVSTQTSLLLEDHSDHGLHCI